MKNQVEENKQFLKKNKEAAKAKQKANKPPVTIKVNVKLTTLIGWVGIILVIVGAYVAGGAMAQAQNDNYKADVRSEAAALVEQLKSRQ